MSLKNQRRILDTCSNNTKSIVAERLNKLCKFLDETYDINAGGCCFVTYCIAKLLKQDKFKFKIVIFDNYPVVGKTLADIDGSHFHYSIMLGDYLINSGDCEENFSFIQSVFSKVKVSDILDHYKTNFWNTEYNKQKNSFISKTLKVFYDDLTEDLRERPKCNQSI